MITVAELNEKCGFKALCMPCGNRIVDGCYMGDLLSWVMGRANENNAWITIMTNNNIVAVATLADVSCIVLAENVEIDKEIISTAENKGVNILLSQLPQYETALRLSEYLQI